MDKHAQAIEKPTSKPASLSIDSESISVEGARKGSSGDALLPTRKAMVLTLPIAATYLFLAWLVSYFFTLVSPIWPSAGIAVAAVMLYGKSALPGIFAGSFLANVLFFSWGALGATLVSLGNAMAPMLGVALYHRSTTEGFFESPKSVGRYLLYVALIGSVISALIGTLTLYLLHLEGSDDLLLYPLLGWWVTNISSTLILAPAFYLWGQWFQSSERLQIAGNDSAELFFVWIATAAGSLLLFGYRGNGSVLHIGMMSLVVPPLIWVAQRFNPRITLTIFANMYLIAVGCTMLDRGPFAFFPLEESLTAIQIMGTSISTAILIASVLNLQRNRVMESLREMNESLGSL